MPILVHAGGHNRGPRQIVVSLSLGFLQFAVLPISIHKHKVFLPILLAKDMKLYHCWMEDFEVTENRHLRSVSHIRETMAESYNGTRQPPSQDSSVPGNPGNSGNGQPRVPKPKKEKTDEQLARAVILISIGKCVHFERSYRTFFFAYLQPGVK